MVISVTASGCPCNLGFPPFRGDMLYREGAVSGPRRISGREFGDGAVWIVADETGGLLAWRGADRLGAVRWDAAATVTVIE